MTAAAGMQLQSSLKRTASNLPPLPVSLTLYFLVVSPDPLLLRRWLDSSLVKVALDTARQRGCKVGLSIAAGKAGRISVLSIDSISPPAAAVAAPLQARNSFVRTAAQPPPPPLAKSREERSGRQMLMKQPLVYDGVILRMLLPHIDALAPPRGLLLNTRSA